MPSPSPAFSREELVSATTALVTQRRCVRFQDVDAASTIYFARVLEYFGDAYLELLTAAGLDVPSMLRSRTLAAPLAHAEADYFAPLFFGDEVAVEVVRARLGKTSLCCGHRMTRVDGKVAAVGITVHVFVDGKTFQPEAAPEGLRRFIEGVGGVELVASRGASE